MLPHAVVPCPKTTFPPLAIRPSVRPIEWRFVICCMTGPLLWPPGGESDRFNRIPRPNIGSHNKQLWPMYGASIWPAVNKSLTSSWCEINKVLFCSLKKAAQCWDCSYWFRHGVGADFACHALLRHWQGCRGGPWQQMISACDGLSSQSLITAPVNSAHRLVAMTQGQCNVGLQLPQTRCPTSN